MEQKSTGKEKRPKTKDNLLDKPKEKRTREGKILEGNEIWYCILAVIVPVFLTFCTGYFYKEPVNEWIRNTVMLFVSSICLIFGWFLGKTSKSIDYNNELHFGRFVFIYIGGVIYACLLPLLPFPVWPFMALSLALALFSNSFLGLYSYSVIVMFASFLASATPAVFFLYFLSGAMTIILFQNIDEKFRVGIPASISLMFFFVIETANIVLFINESLSWEMFVLPILNLFLTGLLLLGVLKYFSFSIIHKYRNKYLEINDPEFTLMVNLKQQKKEAYFLALHTAYFAERIAANIGADIAVAKATAYYHKMGRALKENGSDSEIKIINDICEEYEFPLDIVQALRECVTHNYKTRECTIVMFADAVVSAVIYLFENNKSVQPDYIQLIEMIFKKKIDSGILMNSEITLHDLEVMKQIFIKEKLYYDFLR